MRAVVQRVAQASVTGGGKTAAIGKGLCVLVGITHDDTKDDSDYLIKKLLSLRLFGSDSGPDRSDPVPDVVEEKAPSTQRWTSSVVDIQGEILLVSQFTLHAVYKGSKASFHRAMPGAESEAMFYGMSERLRQQYNVEAVKDCVFGSDMNVSLVNVGPVTLILDSKQPKGG
ncbi:hypothetical protein BU14_0268s0007 [Porphyra umbilicalis]|uniref:D-aminoacyl-tRNA deacylase n=1 Tax=Porphyra umbilicalis TaxID=2786 RepID=A0A1X6P1W5_PORUM|nr:hypothetical protein BU14_0268s0007 [Porphyra umbilicalis]|eukprot:OSX74766.1 hypothetical protein BU14_0268s0007 [Porphyra umbilicalis]